MILNHFRPELSLNGKKILLTFFNSLSNHLSTVEVNSNYRKMNIIIERRIWSRKMHSDKIILIVFLFLLQRYLYIIAI